MWVLQGIVDVAIIITALPIAAYAVITYGLGYGNSPRLYVDGQAYDAPIYTVRGTPAGKAEFWRVRNCGGSSAVECRLYRVAGPVVDSASVWFAVQAGGEISVELWPIPDDTAGALTLGFDADAAKSTHPEKMLIYKDGRGNWFRAFDGGRRCTTYRRWRFGFGMPPWVRTSRFLARELQDPWRPIA